MRAFLKNDRKSNIKSFVNTDPLSNAQRRFLAHRNRNMHCVGIERTRLFDMGLTSAEGQKLERFSMTKK
jgi:hypothetical protein